LEDLTAIPDVKGFADAASNASKADKFTRDGAIARMDVYVEWLLTPTDMRVPKWKKDVATLLGVTMPTLQKYDHDPWLRREFIKRSRVAFTVSRSANVIETLYQRATDPDDPQGVSAAKALMQYMSAQDEREDSDKVDLSELTADQLVKMAKTLADQAKGKK
jgi:hypothetical protein